MKLINRDKDFHMHTLNWSDGMNTVDELVQYAGKLGLKEIVITDHSRADLVASGISPVSSRLIMKSFENVHNDVLVRFGVEADLLNEAGDVCMYIDEGVEETFVVLSAHSLAYSGDRNKVTEGYINAIRRFHKKIDIIGHLDANYFAKEVDMLAVIAEANKYAIPLEFNCKSFLWNWSKPEHTKLLLENADEVMLNSDAHRLSDLKNREKGFAWLKENGYIDN